MGATVISAIPTAFEESGGLDADGTARIAEHALRGGVDRVLVNGTTGEFPSLSRPERLTNLRAVLQIAGPERVIAHVGASSAYEAAAMASDAIAMGATAIAAITPYFLPASQAALLDYFTAVRRVAPDAAFYAYLFPARTGIEITPQAAAQLVIDLDLSGIKLSIPGVGFVRDIVDLLPAAKQVYSGNDSLIVETTEAGGAGVVSGVSAAVPEVITALARRVHAQASERAAAQTLVNDAVNLLGPNIGALKAALRMQGVIRSAASRMTIDPSSDQTTVAVARLLERVAAERFGAPVATALLR